MASVVVLDFDGTLVDSVGSIWAEYQRVMSVMGLRKVSFREFSWHVGKTWEQVLRGIWPGVDVQEFTRLYRREAENHTQFPGVSNALEELGRSHALVIMTSRGEKSLAAGLKAAGIDAGLFKRIYHRDNLARHKPEPEALLQVSREMGVKPSDVLYVGDALVDAECARRAGVRFIGVLTGAASRQDFAEASASEVVESVAFLPRFLGFE